MIGKGYKYGIVGVTNAFLTICLLVEVVWSNCLLVIILILIPWCQHKD